MVPLVQGLLDFKTMAMQSHLHHLFSSVPRLQMEASLDGTDQEDLPEGTTIW